MAVLYCRRRRLFEVRCSFILFLKDIGAGDAICAVSIVLSDSFNEPFFKGGNGKH